MVTTMLFLVVFSFIFGVARGVLQQSQDRSFYPSSFLQTQTEDYVEFKLGNEKNKKLRGLYPNNATLKPSSPIAVYPHTDFCNPPWHNEISSYGNYYTSPEEILNSNLTYDAIIIPSGGLDDQGAPKKFVQARMDALGPYGNITQYWISSGGYTPMKERVVTSSGNPIGEGRADAIYLSNTYDIPKNKIILEETAKDTLGNAYFSRIICDLLEMKRILVVSSRFQIPRLRVAFDWVFSLPHVRTPVEVHYLEVPNTGLSDKDAALREEKEQQSLKHLWCSIRKDVDSMKSLTEFILLNHRAYAMDSNVGSYNVKVSPEVLAATY